MALVYVLDIGHGNCTVVRDNDTTIVVDAGPKNSLLLFMREQNISFIDRVLISHADADHISGLLSVLSSHEVKVGSVWLNSDAMKQSKIWDDLLHELDQKDRNSEIKLHIQLTDNDGDIHSSENVKIDVLSPSKYIAARGPGSTDKSGRPLTTNTVSSVIKISHGGAPLVLLAADIDAVGLDNIIANGHDLNSKVLIFPHHGGRAGNVNLSEFTETIWRSCNPEKVIFSIGRGSHGTPNPEIVRKLKELDPSIEIMCTQISTNCMSDLVKYDGSHLAEVFSKGRETMKSCAGSLVFELRNTENIIATSGSHGAFVRQHIERPLCSM